MIVVEWRTGWRRVLYDAVLAARREGTTFSVVKRTVLLMWTEQLEREREHVNAEHRERVVIDASHS